MPTSPESAEPASPSPSERLRRLLAAVDEQRAVVDAHLSRPATWRGSLRDRRRRGDADRDRTRVAEAFDWLSELAPDRSQAVDVPLILELHRRATGGGVFRRGHIRVGRDRSCPPPTQVPRLVRESLERLGAADDHPALAAARGHLELVRIHPFPDGNGRTARLLAALWLMRAGYHSTLLTAVEQHWDGDGLGYRRSFTRLLGDSLADAWIEAALGAMVGRSKELAWLRAVAAPLGLSPPATVEALPARGARRLAQQLHRMILEEEAEGHPVSAYEREVAALLDDPGPGGSSMQGGVQEADDVDPDGWDKPEEEDGSSRGSSWSASASSSSPTSTEDVCSVEELPHGTVRICVPRTTESQRSVKVQEPAQSDLSLAYGVWAHNGAFADHHIDHHVRGRGLDFAFIRNYRSSISYDSILGKNWDHRYNVRVVPQPGPGANIAADGWCERFPGPGGGPLDYYHGTGRVTTNAFASWDRRVVQWCGDAVGSLVQFEAIVSTYAPNPGEVYQIERYAVVKVLSGTLPRALQNDSIFYRIRFRHDLWFLLNCHGYLVEIRDRFHDALRFEYGDTINPVTLYFVLKRITDTVGRQYDLDYRIIDLIPRLVTVREGSRQVVFDYDADVQLRKVSLVTGQVGTPELHYRYKPGGSGSLLTEIVNPVEAATTDASYLENSYDQQERVSSQRLGTPSPPVPPAGTSPDDYPTTGGTYALRYLGNTVELDDRESVTWTYTLQTDLVTSVSVDDTVYDGGAVTQRTLTTGYTYDANLHLETVIYPSGRREEFRYRNTSGPVRGVDELDDVTAGVGHYNDLARDDLLTHNVIPNDGSPPFSAQYEYEHLFNAPASITSELGQTTRFRYDGGHAAAPERNGNVVEAFHPAQIEPDGTELPASEVFEYGTGGAQKKHVDADLVTHDYQLSELGLVERHRIGGELDEAFEYDDRGNLTERTDARGFTWKCTQYDARDNLLTKVDPLGHEQRFDYDLSDRPVSKSYLLVDDPTLILGWAPAADRPLVEQTAYDILGHRIRLTQRATSRRRTEERTWRWRYDREERPVRFDTPRATANESPRSVLGYAYNHRGMRSEVTEGSATANGSTVTTVYSPDGHPAFVRTPVADRLGEHVTRYDGYARVASETLVNGAVKHREYNGPVLRREWWEGEIHTGPAVLGGQRLQRVLREVWYDFDYSMRVIRLTEKVFLPEFRYQISDPAFYESTVETYFTAAGRTHKVVDPTGREAVHHHDPQGCIRRTDLPGGHRQRFRHDGPLVTEVRTRLVAPAGTTAPVILIRETRFYDPLGRVVASRDGNGVVRLHAYDSAGDLRGVLDGLSLRTFRYDGFFRRVRETITDVASDSNPSGVIRLRCAYDLNDNVTGSWDGADRKTTATFDPSNRMSTLDQPDQEKMTFSRYPDGRLQQVHYARGRTREVCYRESGATGRVIDTVGTERLVRRFGYDGLDRLTWATDSNGGPSDERVQVFRSYDSLARLVRERLAIPELGFDRELAHTYRPDHTQSTLHYPAPNFALTQHYGADGNVSEIWLGPNLLVKRYYQGPGRVLESVFGVAVTVGASPTPVWIPGSVVTEFERTTGRPKLRRVMFRNRLLPSNPAKTFGLPDQATSYSPVHGLVESIVTPDVGPLAQSTGAPNAWITAHYDYDGAARLRHQEQDKLAEWTTQDFDWDAQNRLTKVARAHRAGPADPIDTFVEPIEYPSSDVRTETDASGMTSIWRFDASARLALRTRTYLGGAPPRSDRYSYDGADRLREVSGDGWRATYLYDALGRLVARQEGGGSLVILSDDARPVLEYEARAGAIQQVRKYAYDDAGQVVAYQYRESGGPPVDTIPILNADGSPWLLLRHHVGIANLPMPRLGVLGYHLVQARILLEERINDPFTGGAILRYDGSLPPRTVTQSVLPVGVAGRRRFEPEGLDYVLRRFYHPDLQQFLTPDPLGANADPSSLANPRAFAGNNPAMLKDDGNFAFIILALLIGAGCAVVRQLAEENDQRRDHIDWGEVAESALVGAILAPVVAACPYVGFALASYSLAQDYVAWKFGDIGTQTLLFDVAMTAPQLLGEGERSPSRRAPDAVFQVNLEIPTGVPAEGSLAQWTSPAIKASAALIKGVKSTFDSMSWLAKLTTKAGKPLKAIAERNLHFEWSALGFVRDQMRALDWEAMDSISYGANNGIDLWFRVGKNEGKIALVEVKHGSFSSSQILKVDTKGIEQGSFLFFFTRLARAIDRSPNRPDLQNQYRAIIHHLASGNVEFFGGFLGDRQLYQFNPKVFRGGQRLANVGAASKYP